MSNVSKATFWFLVCNILTKCISMLTTPIFTRLLSTEEMGVFNTFLSWTQILTIIVTLRLDFSVFYKGMEKFSDQKDEYTATMQTITSFLTILFFCIYIIFQKPINQITGLSTLLSILLFVEIFFYSAISFWMLRQRYTFQYRSVIGVTLGLTFTQTLLGIIGVIVTNYQGVGRILAWLLSNIVFGIFIYIHNYKKSKHIYVRGFAKFALMFTIPLLPHYFSSYVLDQFDRIMIQHIIGYAAVGIYSVGFSCGYVIRIITSSFNNTLIPWIFQTLKKQDYQTLRRCINSIFHCVLICFMGYMTLAPEIVHIFAPVQYYNAVYTMVVITASAFLIFVYELYSNMEIYFGENKFSMYIAIVGSVMNMILNYIFILKYGYTAAAYTTMVSYIYFCISHFIYIRRVMKKKIGEYLFPYRDLSVPVICMVMYALFISSILTYQFVRYGIVLLLIIYTFVQRKKIFAFLTLMK